MFDTIILLTGSIEQPVLARALREQNPQITIYPAGTMADLAVVAPDLLSRARLIAFASPVVVPAQIINALGYGAYNFHPGPPEFPGWAASQFAIYRGATEFGATAHVMVERVDAGPIVAVERFPIKPLTGADELEKLTYAHLAKIFWQLVKPLATQSEPLPQLAMCWTGQKGSRRNYAALCRIPLDIAKEELERRIEAFGGNYFGIRPTVGLHGFQFELVLQKDPEFSAQKNAPRLTANTVDMHHDNAA